MVSLNSAWKIIVQIALKKPGPGGFFRSNHQELNRILCDRVEAGLSTATVRWGSGQDIPDLWLLTMTMMSSELFLVVFTCIYRMCFDYL